MLAILGLKRNGGMEEDADDEEEEEDEGAEEEEEEAARLVDEAPAGNTFCKSFRK